MEAYIVAARASVPLPAHAIERTVVVFLSSWPAARRAGAASPFVAAIG